jgi:hypothetical protein
MGLYNMYMFIQIVLERCRQSAVLDTMPKLKRTIDGMIKLREVSQQLPYTLVRIPNSNGDINVAASLTIACVETQYI